MFTIRKHELMCASDVEIVGQPVSEADRKFWNAQKVLGGFKLSVKILTSGVENNDYFCQKV